MQKRKAKRFKAREGFFTLLLALKMEEQQVEEWGNL